MKEVELDIVEKEECEAQFKESRLGQKFSLDKSFICAGGKPEKDTCKGCIICFAGGAKGAAWQRMESQLTHPPTQYKILTQYFCCSFFVAQIFALYCLLKIGGIDTG